MTRTQTFMGYRPLPLLLLLLVAGSYGLFLLRHAVNIPQGDDITDVLGFMIALDKASTAGEIIAALWASHNDHHTLSSRLWYWLSHSLQGVIDFRTLLMLASGSLLLILSLLWGMIRGTEHRAWVILGAACLLLQLRAYDLVLWPMAAFAYFGVFAYGFAALFLLHRVNTLRFAAATLLAALSTFTLASGQVVWLLGLCMLGQQAWLHRRISGWVVALWLALALGVLWSWRIGMHSPNTLGEVLRLALETPAHHLGYFLALLGSAFSPDNLFLARLAALLMLAALSLDSLRAWREGDVRLQMCCWFVVLSLATLALGRAPYSAAEYALASRYSFPSVLFVCSLWVLLASRYLVQRPGWLLALVLALACNCIASYQYYSEPLQVRMERLVNNFNRGQYRIFGTPPKVSNAIVRKAVRRELYIEPERPHPQADIQGFSSLWQK